MIQRWGIRQKQNFQDFVREVIEENTLDYIFLLERKGKLYDLLQLIPTEFEGYIGYDWSAKLLPSSELENKHIGIFDDIVRHGTTLEKFCGAIESRTNGKAHVYPIALLGPKDRSDLRIDVKFKDAIDEKHLFSIEAAGLEENLNNGIISEELKEIFETNGFPLFEPTIQKDKVNKWEIITEETIYIIKKEDGKLNIHDDKKAKQIIASATDYLLSKGIPLDVDHPMIKIKLKLNGQNVDYNNFLKYLATLGNVFIIPPLPSHRHDTITLDQPHFFDIFEDGKDQNVEKEGVIKIRLYINKDEGVWYIVPIVYPSASINLKKYMILCDGEKQVPFCKILSHYVSLDNRTKIECCYRCKTVNLSLTLAQKFLDKITSFLKEWGYPCPEFTVLEKDLKWYYSSPISEVISKILSDYIGELSHTRNKNISEQGQSDLFSFSHKNADYQIRDLSKEYIEDIINIFVKFNKEISNLSPEEKLSWGLSFTEIKSRNPSLKDIEISKALDILLDLGVLKPLNIIKAEKRIIPEEEEIILDKTYKCFRAYRFGEIGENEKARADVRSRERAARLIPLIISTVIKREQSTTIKRGESDKKGLASRPTNKAGTVFMKMWTRNGLQYHDSDTAINLKAETRPWGPMLYCPELPTQSQLPGESEIKMRNSELSLKELGVVYQTFKYVDTTTTIDVKRKISEGYKARGDRSSSFFAPVEGWNADLDDYFDKESNAYTFLMMYADVVNYLHGHAIIVSEDKSLDGKRHRLDALTTLSACTTEDEAFKYWITDLREWRKFFDGFLSVMSRYTKLLDKEGTSKELQTSIDKTIDTAAKMAMELGEKIMRYGNLDMLKEIVNAIGWPMGYKSEVDKLLSTLEIPPKHTERSKYLEEGYEVIRLFTHLTQNILSTLDIIPDTRRDKTKKVGDYLHGFTDKMPISNLNNKEFLHKINVEKDVKYAFNWIKEIYYSKIEREVVLHLDALGTLYETRSVENVKEIVKRLPPEEYNKRIFIGGSYDYQMDTLRRIEKCVNEIGLIPVIAYDFDVPKEEINDYDVYLLRMCAHAIIEVTNPAGQYLELQSALDFWKPEDILVTWQKRDPAVDDLPDHITSMIRTKPFKKRGYLSPHEPLEKVITEMLREVIS